MSSKHVLKRFWTRIVTLPVSYFHHHKTYKITQRKHATDGENVCSADVRYSLAPLVMQVVHDSGKDELTFFLILWNNCKVYTRDNLNVITHSYFDLYSNLEQNTQKTNLIY